MPKVSLMIVALVSLLAFLLNLQQYDADSSQANNTENKLTATQQKSTKKELSASTENIGQSSLDQNITYAGSMTADGKLTADPITLRMDYLLVTDKLTDFQRPNYRILPLFAKTNDITLRIWLALFINIGVN
ncbi:MAG: hypothetical protein IPN42_03535 [Methylococcaceae bacterium]|nr:hypothetical protein [Methylococcaceae bacterium]